MTENSRIEWTTHTFNPWWGCARVSPGCENCYAETLDRRVHGKEGAHWGAKTERRFFGEKHWNDPRRWNDKAAEAGERHRVFCSSMADVFEDRDDLIGARARLFGLIVDTPHLDWLLLTKRPQNAERLWLGAKIDAFGNWTDSVTGPDWAENVWVGVTAEDQQRADERIPVLASIPAVVRFVSFEPLLGPILLTQGAVLDIDWAIVGGESGHGARPMNPAWAQSLRDQCTSRGVAFFFKQWGEWADNIASGHPIPPKTASIITLSTGSLMGRFGKKLAGRELDGRTWDELPTARARIYDSTRERRLRALFKKHGLTMRFVGDSGEG